MRADRFGHGRIRRRTLQHADAGARLDRGLLGALASVVANMPGDHAVGLAFPSVIRGGVVRTAANLNKAWIGKPLAELGRQHLKRPVIAINDADAAGLAELRTAPRAMYRAPCCC
jgi:predicted NBD/HSP70 family sugar kinase